MREIGLVEVRPGKVEKLWARWNVPYDKRQHEAEITAMLLLTHADWVKRGWEVDELANDAVCGIAGKTFRFERDKGTMGYQQIMGRIKQHENCPDFWLWVCDTQTRIEGIRRRAESVRRIILLTTYERFIEEGPHTPIWIDYEGNMVALPRTQPHTQPHGGGQA